MSFFSQSSPEFTFEMTDTFCLGARQLSKVRRLFKYEELVFSITCDWNVNCVLSCTGCDVDEEPDAEDHEEGKR